MATPKKAPEDIKPSGRKTLYKTSYNKQAYKLSLLGATDKQIADFFEVCEDTVNEWKKVYPKFSVSIKSAKLIADANIADGLYNRAKGMTVVEQTAVKLTTKKPVLNAEGEPTRLMMQTEVVEVVDLKKEIPPDTTAAIIWLKNRNPQNWKDKQQVDLANADGKPLEHVVTINVKRNRDNA